MAHRSIPELLREVSSAHPDEVAYRFKRGGRWTDVTWAENEAASRGISKALIALGVKKGDRVAILSQTRLEWVQCDQAITGCGGVTVGIYPSSTAADCAYILRHSDSRVVFVEDGEQLAKLHSVRGELPQLRQVVFEDPGDPSVLGWEDLLQKAANVGDEELEERRKSIGRDDLASIVYTSGTTGIPKGAMLTHRNLLFASESASHAMAVGPDRVYLLFLPLAHVFARMTVLLCVRTRSTIAFAESIHKVGENLREIRPHFTAGVPRIFEKLHATIWAEVRKAGGLKERIFLWALKVGGQASQRKQQGRRLSPWLVLRRAIANVLVFRKMKAQLGGRVEFMISGAAPLDKSIAEFFHACGILVLEGIGMTENASFSHVNRRDRYRFGTVGLAGPGIQTKIAPDGEVWIRGPNVMKGYLKDPEATAQAIDGVGWLHTGDIGEIDPDGFLKITDRKKDLIITSGGKNVAPQRVEQALKSSRFISQAVVFGDRKKYLTALVTLDPEQIRLWAGQNGRSQIGFEDLARDPQVQTLIDAAVDTANRELASFESVKKVRILPADFSVESGELTPTLKIRRKVIAERYRPLVEEMYQE